MPKSSCLKQMYGHPGIDYRVASLFTRYLTAIGIISESRQVNSNLLSISYGLTKKTSTKMQKNFVFKMKERNRKKNKEGDYNIEKYIRNITKQ